MNDNIAHQIGQVLADSHPTLGKVADWVGGTVTAVLIWIGAVGGQFSRIFDPSTWDMQTIASFCSILVAIMYFLKLRAERKLAQQLLKNAEVTNVDSDRN